MQMSFFPRWSPWMLGAVLCLSAVAVLDISAHAASDGAQRVDVNSADEKTLAKLPGISPTLAHSIVDGRPYKNVEDLKKVHGLTATKLDAIKDKITFGHGTKTTSAKSAKSSTSTKNASTGSPKTAADSAAAADQPSGTGSQPKARSSSQPVSPTGASSGRLATGQTVNINTATAEELDALPGIGPTKAQAIVDYRNEHGRFNSIEDIKNVKGIKDGEFAEIKDLIRIK